MIPIHLSKEQKQSMINELIRYFETERSESIGELAAENLLVFLMQHIGPVYYNKGVEDAKRLIVDRMAAVEDELYTLQRPL